MIIPASHRVQQVQSYYFARKLAEIAEMNRSGEQVINLGIGSPDLSPPINVIECLQQTCDQPAANTYQSYKGIPALRSAFAGWYKRYYKIDMDPEKEVLPLMGSKEGIMHISMSFLNPGDRVLVPNPGYPAYSMTAKLAYAIPLEYDLLEKNNWQPDFEQLEKMDLKGVKIMWVNYPHMPTGAVASAQCFEQLVKFGQKHNILICHDNPYSFILNNNPRSIFSISDSIQNCIELNSLSKCFNMAGWRVGVMMGATEYINTVMRFKSNMDSGMYKPIQLAAIEAMKSGDDWYEKNNQVYIERKNSAEKLLALLDCDLCEHAAGFFLWAKLKNGLKSEEYIDVILKNARVFLTPGTIFGTNGDGYVRLSLCSPKSEIEKAMVRIKKFQALEKIAL